MNTALAELRTEKHLSASSLGTYIRCPRQFEHRYILGTPASHRAVALVFGSAFHTALAAFYRGLQKGQEPSLEEMQDTFRDAWTLELDHPIPVLLDSEKDTEDGLLDKGQLMLKVFHQQAPRPHKVVEVEMPMSIELVDPFSGEVLDHRLVGVLDAVVQQDDGSYQILEHKTGARRWSDDRLRYDLQLTGYSMVAPMIGLGVAQVVVQLLTKTKQPALEIYNPTRTKSDYKDFQLTMAGVLRAIESGAFFPIRDWHCKSCPYAGPCLAG